MSRHKTTYVISYRGILCHDMSYVTTIAASLLQWSVVIPHQDQYASNHTGYYEASCILFINALPYQ